MTRIKRILYFVYRHTIRSGDYSLGSIVWCLRTAMSAYPRRIKL